MFFIFLYCFVLFILFLGINIEVKKFKGVCVVEKWVLLFGRDLGKLFYVFIIFYYICKVVLLENLIG